MYRSHLSVLAEVRSRLSGKTPSVVYCEQILSEQCAAIIEPVTSSFVEGKVYFPIKASYEPFLLKAMTKNGLAGFEVMSQYELKHIRSLFGYKIPVIYSGLCPESLVLQSIQPDKDVLVINSLNDAFAVADFLRDQRYASTLRVLLRISFPGLNSKIGYNGRDSKLGIIAYSNEMYRCLDVLRSQDKLVLSGLHCHQLIHQTSTDEYKRMMHQMAKLIQSIESSTQFSLTMCDIGGGLESMSHDETRRLMKDLCQEFSYCLPNRELIFEPGRALVNSCGICITEVIGQRVRTETLHCTVDVGTNLLVPTTSKRYRVIQSEFSSDPDQTGLQKTARVTISDRVLSPANTIEDEVYMVTPPQIGDELLIGNSGAYTSSLEHQWFQPLHSTYFLASDNTLTTLFSSEQAHLNWKNRLETTL